MINLHYGLGTLFFQYKDQNDNKLHTYGSVIRNNLISIKELNLPEKDDLMKAFKSLRDKSINPTNTINITDEERNDKEILKKLAENYKDKTDWQFIKISLETQNSKCLINYIEQKSIKHFSSEINASIDLSFAEIKFVGNNQVDLSNTDYNISNLFGTSIDNVKISKEFYNSLFKNIDKYNNVTVHPFIIYSENSQNEDYFLSISKGTNITKA